MSSTPNKKVLIVLSSATPTMGDGKKSGWYWPEVYHPYEVFTKAGYHVDFVSLTGSGAPDEKSISTTTQLAQFELSALKAWKDSSHPIHEDLKKLKSPNQINPTDYGIIFFAGKLYQLYIDYSGSIDNYISMMIALYHTHCL